MYMYMTLYTCIHFNGDMACLLHKRIMDNFRGGNISNHKQCTSFVWCISVLHVYRAEGLG
jgi:hypothetical protein